MILDNLIELYSIVLFSVEGDHSLTIDPELVAFACSNQNYSSLAHNDQVRLSSIRLEVLRIGIGIRRQTLIVRTRDIKQNNPEQTSQAPNLQRIPRVSCIICFATFTTKSNVVAANCGHVYCRPCFHDCFNLNRSCGLCSAAFQSTISYYMLYFRFNYRHRIICRHCMREITSETSVIASACGDVFCGACYQSMTTHCLGCDRHLHGDRHLTLHLSFH